MLGAWAMLGLGSPKLVELLYFVFKLPIENFFESYDNCIKNNFLRDTLEPNTKLSNLDSQRVP